MHKSLHLLMSTVIILFFLSLSLGLTVNTDLCSVNATNEEAKPSSALERIRADYEAGELTVDQNILYTVWAASDPSRLLDTKYKVSLEEPKHVEWTLQ